MQRPTPHRRRGASDGKTVLFAAFIAAIIATAAVLGMALLRPHTGGPAVVDEGLPDLGPAPAWTLTDMDGNTVTHEDLRGKTYAVVFFFLQCKTVCPGMLQQLKQLNDAIASSDFADDLILVGMSVDGTRDTPDALRAYVQSNGLDPTVTRLLTADDATVFEVADGFGFPETGPNLNDQGFPVPGNEFLHPQAFTLVDANGRMRGRYKYAFTTQMQMLLNDAQRLIRGE